VAGTVANNVRCMATLESACARQGDTVNLRHIEKNLGAKFRKNFDNSPPTNRIELIFFMVGDFGSRKRNLTLFLKNFLLFVRCRKPS